MEGKNFFLGKKLFLNILFWIVWYTISIKKSRMTMIWDQHFGFSVSQLVISKVIWYFLTSITFNHLQGKGFC